MDDRLVLADGTVIDTKTGERVADEQYIEVPRHSEAVFEITERRRRLADLPDVPERMNVVSSVIAYALVGLSNMDIGRALSMTVDQVKEIKETQAYSFMMKEMAEAIMEQDAENIRAMFREASHRAAERVSGLIGSDSEHIALAAAKDMLDRDGFRPADTLEYRRVEESTLRIEVVKKDESVGRIIDSELS